MTDDNLSDDLGSAVRNATKKWTKEKKKQERPQLDRLRRGRKPRQTTIKAAAYEVMEEAYQKASGGGQYYTNARQIMYAARPMILDLTDGKIWSNDTYFTQTILKDYLDERSPDWKVVWDARGHLHEPHTETSVNLGGIGVMKYEDGWRSDFLATPTVSPSALIDTKGPALRYGAALWIEKEGFAPILEDAGIAERYDLAIMSTKGMATKAAVELGRQLGAAGVRVFVLHDFDKSAFEILNTIREGTRLLFSGVSDLVDLGLRLEDVEEHDLEAEPVKYQQTKNPKTNLRRCGATDEEATFLVQSQTGHGWWEGERVELNAMTSDQFVDWIEDKLEDHGVEKFVPDADELAKAYRRAKLRQRASEAIREVVDERDGQGEVPDHLGARVRSHLDENPADTWEQAVAAVAVDEEGHDQRGE